MNELFNALAVLVASATVGYVLGAFPVAAWISRRRGIDIYSAGTGLPGAANVMRTVGVFEGGLVLSWDLGKGGLAVLAGFWIGADGTQILLPVGTVLIGHWFSIFSGFKGGDGLATLGGAAVILFGSAGLVTVVVAMIVALGGQRMPYPSLLSIVLGYCVLAGLNLSQSVSISLTAGFGGLASLVLARAILGHLKRRHIHNWDSVDSTENNTQKFQ